MMEQDLTPAEDAVDAPEPVDQPEAVEAPEVEQPEWSDDDAESARAFGWKPSDEWQGDKPPGYIEDPREWTARVERSPIFKTMKGKIDQQAEAQAESMRKLEAISKSAFDRQKADHEREMADLGQKRRQAAEVGDLTTYDDLSKQEADLRASAPQEAPVEQNGIPQPDPWLSQYRESEDGAWMKNPILLKEAMEAVNMSGGDAGTTAEEQTKYAERVMRQAGRLPNKQPAPKPQRQMVDGGGIGAGSSKAGAFNKLPKDGKEGFAFLVRQGAFEDTKEDREAYADEYNNA